MGRLMGSSNSNNYGEQIFINKASEYLDDTNIIYWNRQLFGKEFDVCILMPEKGILVVELKGWREENILRIENNDSVIIQTNDGEVSASPQKQARGYRFSIERHIRQNISKFPLVYRMVCLPQVSKAFFKSHRLDVVMEEKFTILKEDLKDNTSFFNKLDQALREVCHWNRDPFDRRTMLEVRNLFETDINVDEDGESEIEKELASSYHRHDYSRFYYFNEFDQMSGNTINDMVAQYLHGCKLYCVFSKKAQMLAVIKALDTALTQRGLVRNRDNIEIAFDEQKSHTPLAESVGDMFMGFHCSMSVLSAPFDKNTTSFAIPNGSYSSAQKRILEKLSEQSQFNFEQYQVEHATPEKNIVIRAGAGTGKTYTMISRIGFICYTQNVPLQKMADRIVMITFTNEAADQMEEKLKAYFKNCYLVTSKPDYLQMISQIDHMQISTIHSYAKNLIAQMGTSFGYGIDLSITSSEFYRRKKISDLLDAYIYQKEIEQGKNYTDKLGMPVYAIRDSILDFIGKLHNKSVDIGAIEPQDFGTLLNNESHGELHELLASVIPAVEREYFEELIEDNKIHLSSMMSVLNRFINNPESESRIRELKKDKHAQQFMFVDEFQDTDDSQIESLLRISQVLDYKLFLVGDIKQCIYRFRGAKEKAFDQLGIAENPDKWLEFSLQRNYRTDKHLLDIFDRSFTKWGKLDDELLTYDEDKDRLIGTQDYNGKYLTSVNRFYRRLPTTSEEMRIPILVEEIKRIQKRIQYEESHGMKLSAKEKSIAILVRENWQADMIRTDCARLGISVHTNTGGDLYMSQPAIDMLTLVNALVHFDEADYLYNLVTSNFFNLDIPKSNLYEIRMKIRTGGWRAKTDEKEQVNYLINFMNLMLANTVDKNNKWEYSKIYSSWNDIYGCFEVPIHHDTVVREYTPPTMQNPSNALACALGEICEDRNAVGSGILRKWYKLYKSVQLMEFANITEYAHFVSNHFDAAIQRYSESRSVMERGNDVWSNAAVLRHLDEQVYTANRDVHTLLKIYYPEYAKDRHFLSYPIGQFFSAIYRLWDYENGKIIFDVNAIKECLSSNILSVAPGEVLLRTFYNVEILFENVTTYDEFQREIVEGYAKNYDKLAGTPGNDALSELKNLSIYNKYKVTKKDLHALIRAIEEINEIATYLFALDNEVITNGSGLFVKPYDSEHMNMRKHFGAALFAVDVSEVERKNPYQEFEALVRRDGWNKIYSLHRLPLPGNQEKADILRNETKLYLNQACRKDKTAIPSDWCIYCVHRENCMESFLRSEVGMSSSRNEPCINRSVRANAPAKTTLPPVCEQEVIDVEAVPAEPIVPATASIIDTAPAVEAPIVETPVVDVPAVEAPASEVVFVESPAAEVPTHVDTPKSPELSIFEQMFRQIQEMVEGNRQEIQSLKGELAARQSRREDTTRIQSCQSKAWLQTAAKRVRYHRTA